MLRGISFKQFREWMAFAELEPFDETRDDYRFASIVAAIANVHRGKGKRAFTVEEMRLMFGDAEKARQSVKQQMHIGMLMAAAYNHAEDQLDAKRRAANDRRQSRNTVRKPPSGR